MKTYFNTYFPFLLKNYQKQTKRLTNVGLTALKIKIKDLDSVLRITKYHEMFHNFQILISMVLLCSKYVKCPTKTECSISNAY